MKKKIIGALKLLIPIILVYYIYSIIDIEKFIDTIKNSNLFYITLALLSVPIQYILFSMRWDILFRKIESIKAPFLYLHKILYKGLFVGFFVPGGVGIDIYRIAAIKKKYGVYKSSISIVLLEKLVGLIASTVLIIIIFPFIAIDKEPEMQRVFLYGMILLSVFIAFLFVVFNKKKLLNSRLGPFIEKGLSFVNKKVLAILKKMQKAEEISSDKEIVKDILRAIFNMKHIFIVFFFSILILVVKAYFMNIMFLAFGFDIPLVANLFVVPLLNIISLMPVSFGGVGVRDTGFIVLYSLFGVSNEGALLVSLITFTYLLINISSGGVIMFFENIKNK